MGRRMFLVAGLGIALLSLFPQLALAGLPDVDTMKVALHTATPEEDGFIHYVMGKVETGALPVDLVESTFLWARQKPKNKFQYFKRGLIFRAAKVGIAL